MQAEPIAVSQLAQMLNQQATLLADLYYFGAVVVVGLVGTVAMYFQRLVR